MVSNHNESEEHTIAEDREEEKEAREYYDGVMAFEILMRYEI